MEPSLILPDPNSVRLIISDVDGTLLDSHHKLSEVTIKTINKVLEKYKNVSYVIATGKTHFSAKELREKLKIKDKPNCPSVHTNGCQIFNDKDELINEEFIPNHIIYENLKIIESLKTKDRYHLALYSGDIVICLVEDETSQLLRDYQEDVVVWPVEEVIKKMENKEIEINKICCFSTPQDTRDVLPILNEFASKYSDNISLTKSLDECVETVPTKGNKGNALKWIMETYNLKPEEIIAFGDNANDISMFKVAGYKYAMGNASDELKKLATSVTKTNDENGEAYVLQQIFLKDEQN